MVKGDDWTRKATALSCSAALYASTGPERLST
jgi:hypothetical protein